MRLAHYDDGKQKIESHEIFLKEDNNFYCKEFMLFRHDITDVRGYGETKEEALQDFKNKLDWLFKVDHGCELNKYGWMFNGVMPLEPWNLDSVFDEESVRATFEIYDGDTNDYRDYKQFLIFDECDIDRLIKVLQWAKNGCPDDGESFDDYEEE